MRGTVDNPLSLFGFLSLFHIVGAAVLGDALRELWHGLREGDVSGCQLMFKIIWATMFGGLPFLFGIQFASSEDGTILFLVGEVVVWTAALVTTLLAKQAIRKALGPFMSQEILLMLFGGSFLLTGVALMSFLTREDRIDRLLTGGIFALVGAAVFGFGLWRLLKATQ
jgi:hypothetical protein